MALVPLAKEVAAAPVPVALMQVASVKTPSKDANLLKFHSRVSFLSEHLLVNLELVGLRLEAVLGAPFYRESLKALFPRPPYIL